MTNNSEIRLVIEAQSKMMPDMLDAMITMLKDPQKVDNNESFMHWCRYEVYI